MKVCLYLLSQASFSFYIYGKSRYGVFMSDEELLNRWKILRDRVGFEEALARLIATKKVSASTAERLSGDTYKHGKPSRKTREALLEALSKRAS